MTNLFVNQKKRVEKIHREFDSAPERAVKEANRIIQSSHHQEIKALVFNVKGKGFSNSKTVEEVLKQEDKRPVAQNILEVVEKYSVLYPNNKFIFVTQVEEICKKYGLICGIASRYKGEIPIKNMREIAAFQPRPEDCYVQRRYAGRADFDVRDQDSFVPASTSKEYLDHTHVPLFICAPPSDMNEKGTMRSGIFRFEDPDPVVLHFVRDGFLIVSKWGPEAEDPILLNEKMN